MLEEIIGELLYIFSYEREKEKNFSIIHSQQAKMETINTYINNIKQQK